MQNEFEKQVKQKMEELDFVPSTPVWNKIEEQIRHKNDRRRLFLLLPLFVLLLAGGIIWMVYKNDQPKQSISINNDVALDQHQNIPPKSNNTIKEQTLDNHTEEVNDHKTKRVPGDEIIGNIQKTSVDPNINAGISSTAEVKPMKDHEDLSTSDNIKSIKNPALSKHTTIEKEKEFKGDVVDDEKLHSTSANLMRFPVEGHTQIAHDFSSIGDIPLEKVKEEASLFYQSKTSTVDSNAIVSAPIQNSSAHTNSPNRSLTRVLRLSTDMKQPSAI